VTAGVQGKEQSGKPNFVGGKVTIGGVEKTVDIGDCESFFWSEVYCSI